MTAAATAAAATATAATRRAPRSFEFEATTLGGERVALKAFKGKPLLVMNVATL